MNSFLAVTIGLMHGAVTRLRQTWKEIPLKQRTRLEQFQALTVSSMMPPPPPNTHTLTNHCTVPACLNKIFSAMLYSSSFGGVVGLLICVYM